MDTGFLGNYKRGLNYADRSFNMIWQNKFLLVYLAVPFVLTRLLQFIVYQFYFGNPTLQLSVFVQSKMIQLHENHTWVEMIGVGLFILVDTLLIVASMVALSYHVAHLIKHESVTIGQSYRRCYEKLSTIIQWTLISVIPVFMGQFIERSSINKDSFSYFVLIVLYAFFAATWALLTMFVVQGIAFSRMSIILLIKESIITLKHEFMALIGGILWVLLIMFIVALPYVIAGSFLVPVESILHIFVKAYFVIVMIISSTVFCVLRVFLYLHYRQKKLNL